jgi:hypothetical protein
MHLLPRTLPILVLLTLCISHRALSPPTARAVLDTFKAAGLQVYPSQLSSSHAPPKSYRERQAFQIAGPVSRDGEVFTCDGRNHCDMIYAYYEATQALVGPYLYQSPGGTVVVLIDKSLDPAEAARFEQVVKALP